MAVNMAAGLRPLRRCWMKRRIKRLGLSEIRSRLEAIERQPPIYKRWMVVVGMALTAASLSRLFGGDWPSF